TVGQPITGRVHHRGAVFLGAEGNRIRHRAEDLLLRTDVVDRTGHHRWLDEVATLGTGYLGRTTGQDQLGTVGDAGLHQPQNTTAGAFGDHRSHIRTVIVTRTNDNLLQALGSSGDDVVEDAFVQDPPCCRA